VLTLAIVIFSVFRLAYLWHGHSNLTQQAAADQQARDRFNQLPLTTTTLPPASAPAALAIVTTAQATTTAAPTAVASPAIALTIPTPSKPAATTAPVVGPVSWKRFDTAWLPYTTDGGPSVANADGTGSGFAFTNYGAAVAAWHLLVRSDVATTPAGLTEVFQSQVVGPAAETLLATALEEHTKRAATVGLPAEGPLPRTTTVPVAYKIYGTTVPGVLAVTIISSNEAGDRLETVTVQVVLYKLDYRRVVNDYNLARLHQGPIVEIPEGFTRYPPRT
jgi:hypothetical protein